MTLLWPLKANNTGLGYIKLFAGLPTYWIKTVINYSEGKSLIELNRVCDHLERWFPNSQVIITADLWWETIKKCVTLNVNNANHTDSPNIPPRLNKKNKRKNLFEHRRSLEYFRKYAVELHSIGNLPTLEKYTPAIEFIFIGGRSNRYTPIKWKIIGN